jgi:hypothetical protein
MTTDFMICNRKKPRWAIRQFEDAYVEFELEGAGRRYGLLDVSVDGISFVVPEDTPEIELDLRIADATVRVDTCEVKGSVRIIHVTPVESDCVCGATFQPSSEDGENRWQGLIEDLRSADTVGRSNA